MAGSIFGKVIGVVLLIVALPIFAAMGILSAAASAGIISMQTIVIQFMPLFGIGAETTSYIKTAYTRYEPLQFTIPSNLISMFLVVAHPLRFWLGSDYSVEEQLISLA